MSDSISEKELKKMTEEIEKNPNVDKNWLAYRKELNKKKKPKTK